MDAEAWATVAAAAAAGIALVALFFTAMSATATRAAARTAEEQTKIQELAARTAEEQTEIQRQLRIDAAQPYVWVDIRPDDAQGTLLNLVIGNSGPTVAENVRVVVDPSLPMIEHFGERVGLAQTRLAEGIRSLAPGRTLVWRLGQAFKLLGGEGPLAHTFTVTADGPFGPVPEVTYVVDISELRGAADQPAGSLHELTRTVKDVVKRLDRIQAQRQPVD